MNVVTTNGVMQEPNNFLGINLFQPYDNNQETQQNSIIK